MSLFRCVNGLLESLCGQLVQQMNVVEEKAMSPLQALVQTVVGGAWRGVGANAFVEELMSIGVPSIKETTAHISFLNTNVQRAQQIINQADETADRLVRSKLTDTFDFY